MASEKDQYANLFGSSDEESGDEEEEEEEQQQQQPPAPPKQQAAAPPAAPAAQAAAASSSEESSSSSSSSESEDDRPAKKRATKGKKARVVRKKPAAARSSDESSDEDEKGAKASAPAARSRALGAGALARAAADFAEAESSDEEGGGGGAGGAGGKPFVARSVTSGSSSSSSGSEGEDNSSDSDAGGDSRRRKRLQQKKRGAAQQRKRAAGGSGAGRKARAAAAAAVGSDESDSDREGGGERERGGGGSAAAARRPGRELTVVEQALQKLKRNRAAKLPEKEVQERTQRLIDVMEVAAKEDRLALAQGRPGLSKMAKLPDVLDLLKSKHLQGALVDNAQLLGLIKAWIQPLPDKSLPLYSVRTPLIEYLVNARVEVHRLKESGIGAVVQKLRKHPDETLDNKARLGEIIDNWSRLITGKGTHLKTSLNAEEGRVVSEMNRGGGGGDGFVYAKTARGVDIPIRSGFNFKKVALSFKGMDDRGQGKEDEALEVMEREPRADGVESRATKVRKALKDMGRKGSGKRLRAENVSHSGL